MKRQLVVLLISTLLLPSWLLGNPHDELPKSRNIERKWRLFCQGQWEIDFDLLYWHSTAPRLVYATSWTPPNTFNYTALYMPKSNYNVGYRIGGWHQLGCSPMYVGAWVSWLTNRNKQVKRPLPGGLMLGLAGTAAPIQNAQAITRTYYVAADLEFGQHAFSCSNLSAYLFLAARYVDIDLMSRLSYVDLNPGEDSILFAELNPLLHAVGPRIGLGAQWTFCRCWTIRFKTAGTMLFANRSVRINTVHNLRGDRLTTVSNYNGGTWQVDSRLGLELKVSLQSWSCLRLEGGIMFDHTDDALIDVLPEGANVAPAFHFQPFNVGGLYGHIGYLF